MRSLALFIALALLVACKTPAASGKPAEAAPSTAGAEGKIQIDQGALVAALVRKHGDAARARAEQGVRQVAAYWRAEDGDAAALKAFVEESFVQEPAQLDALLKRFSLAFEQIDGHMLEIGRALRSWSELDWGRRWPVDQLFAAIDVGAHLTEDLFASKLAFVVLLNFPLHDAAEMRGARGRDWSRRQWAEARLRGRFARRVPAGAVRQAVAKAGADAEAYIAEYNIWMHHVLDAERPAARSPRACACISHWNLRDELKADYADTEQASREAAADPSR